MPINILKNNLKRKKYVTNKVANKLFAINGLATEFREQRHNKKCKTVPLNTHV